MVNSSFPLYVSQLHYADLVFSKSFITQSQTGKDTKTGNGPSEHITTNITVSLGHGTHFLIIAQPFF